MSVEVSFAITGPVHLSHSITDAAAGDPAVCVVQLDMPGPASRDEAGAGTGPAIPTAEVLVDLEAPDDMVLSIGLGRAGLAALIDYLTGVQRDWQTGAYR